MEEDEVDLEERKEDPILKLLAAVKEYDGEADSPQHDLELVVADLAIICEHRGVDFDQVVCGGKLVYEERLTIPDYEVPPLD